GERVSMGELDMSPSILLLSGECFDVGIDRRTAVSAEYAKLIPFGYSNKIRHVRITPGAQAEGSEVNRKVSTFRANQGFNTKHHPSS
ncbi:MAG: hypothetical protein ACI94L_001071, partial [Flavobacteriaceae bacterium]